MTVHVEIQSVVFRIKLTLKMRLQQLECDVSFSIEKRYTDVAFMFFVEFKN